MNFNSTWDFISVVGNIVLPLLIFFQWYRSHSREQAAKNGIFAARRMVDRLQSQNAEDILDSLDATLATLGSRKPFREALKNHFKKIFFFWKKEDEKPLLSVQDLINSQREEEANKPTRRKKM